MAASYHPVDSQHQHRPTARCYKQGKMLVESEFCTGGCGNRSRAREAEEFPLLESVARERLVKTQRAGKDLACVVVCELWGLAVAL
jgi:hypothetical protein